MLNNFNYYYLLYNLLNYRYINIKIKYIFNIIINKDLSIIFLKKGITYKKILYKLILILLLYL